jgi:hypothetical protein
MKDAERALVADARRLIFHEENIGGLAGEGVPDELGEGVHLSAQAIRPSRGEKGKGGRASVLIPKYPHEMEMWNLRTLVASLRIFSNTTAFFSNFRVARRS